MLIVKKKFLYLSVAIWIFLLNWSSVMATIHMKSFEIQRFGKYTVAAHYHENGSSQENGSEQACCLQDTLVLNFKGNSEIKRHISSQFYRLLVKANFYLHFDRLSLLTYVFSCFSF